MPKTIESNFNIGAGAESMLPRATATALVILSLASLPGCILGISDSAVRVSGSVVDEDGAPIDSCHLDLRFQGDDKATYTKKIDSEFLRTFTVETGGHVFNLLVRCDGVKDFYVSDPIEIEGNERYENPIALGEIRLSRIGHE